ncbi:MAG: YggT family protein [Gammaproteobacteria bacterium]|jgi:YggT family protein
MNGGYLTEALVFLVRTAFDLYLILVVLRFLLQIVRADFYNPISQFLITATNPPLKYIRRIIPGYKGNDWSSIVLMFLIKSIEILLLSLIVRGDVPALAGLIILSFAQLLNLIIYIFIISIFIQVILSWINPGAYNPATVIIYKLTDPLLRPARKLIPPMGGLDFSVLVVFIILQLTLILIVNPITHIGQSLSGFYISG